VCDLETSRMTRPWPALGRSATKNNHSGYVIVFLKDYNMSLLMQGYTIFKFMTYELVKFYNKSMRRQMCIYWILIMQDAVGSEADMLISQQCRQFTFNLTMRCVRAPIFAVEEQRVLYRLSVCICSLRCLACNAHAPYCHLCPALLYSIFYIIS
jgi:hypothetical protein